MAGTPLQMRSPNESPFGQSPIGPSRGLLDRHLCHGRPSERREQYGTVVEADRERHEAGGDPDRGLQVLAQVGTIPTTACRREREERQFSDTPSEPERSIMGLTLSDTHDEREKRDDSTARRRAAPAPATRLVGVTYSDRSAWTPRCEQPHTRVIWGHPRSAWAVRRHVASLFAEGNRHRLVARRAASQCRNPRAPHSPTSGRRPKRSCRLPPAHPIGCSRAHH
jgi:hypothetical protein